MLTPNCNIICLSWKNKSGTMWYMIIIIQCVLSASINKPCTLLISILTDNICRTLQTTEAKFIYLQTATWPREGLSLQKQRSFFSSLGGVNPSIKHNKD